jgi:hypothetical protein
MTMAVFPFSEGVNESASASSCGAVYQPRDGGRVGREMGREGGWKVRGEKYDVIPMPLREGGGPREGRDLEDEL